MTDKQKPIPIDQITKLADDIRLIQNFSENHNFDATLISSSVGVSVTKSAPTKDWPLVLGVIFTVLVIVIIALAIFCQSLPKLAFNFMFVIGLLFSGIGTICIQKRFSDKTITIIYAISIVSVFLIGTGILTPKEVVGEIQKLHGK